MKAFQGHVEVIISYLPQLPCSYASPDSYVFTGGKGNLARLVPIATRGEREHRLPAIITVNDESIESTRAFHNDFLARANCVDDDDTVMVSKGRRCVHSRFSLGRRLPLISNLEKCIIDPPRHATLDSSIPTGGSSC